ncbi:MAG: polysaccharide deacetylase family protein [Spirochaetes bacterium]|nr:polysaccharide deacetylase family protein [Spirochaetota bacterium]
MINNKIKFFFTIFFFIFFLQLILYKFNKTINANESNSFNNFIFPVLCYHNIKLKETNIYDVSLENFEKQIDYLYKNNFKFIFASEIIELLKNNKNINKDTKYIGITFDDGNNGVYLYAKKIFLKYKIKATIFIYPSIIIAREKKENSSYMSFSQIRDLINTGYFELGCHSFYHPYMTKEDEKGLVLNTIKAKNILYSIIGVDQKAFAYPFGLCNENVINYIKKAGFLGAFTVERKYVSIDTYIYKIPRFLITSNINMEEFIKLVNPK